MIEADGTVRTDEMSFATVLLMNGYAPIMEKTANGGVVWVIVKDEMDDLVEELIEDFKRGACRVEPRRFVREIRQVREDLYKFLGVDGQPKRSPVRRSVNS